MSAAPCSRFPGNRRSVSGSAVLRLSPEQFWRMTPRELAYAIEAASGRSAPLDRNALAQLMARYPDGRQAP
jgi:uncharacterized phage protein (TIGR02216 family)